MEKSYFEKLRDPRWQRRRLEIMNRDGFECACCGSSESTLNVHHMYYEKGKDPWDYPDHCLVTYCEACHLRVHENKRDLDFQISLSGDSGAVLEFLTGCAKAFNLIEEPDSIRAVELAGFEDANGFAMILAVDTDELIDALRGRKIEAKALGGLIGESSRNEIQRLKKTLLEW